MSSRTLGRPWPRVQALQPASLQGMAGLALTLMWSQVLSGVPGCAVPSPLGAGPRLIQPKCPHLTPLFLDKAVSRLCPLPWSLEKSNYQGLKSTREPHLPHHGTVFSVCAGPWGSMKAVSPHPRTQGVLAGPQPPGQDAPPSSASSRVLETS